MRHRKYDIRKEHLKQMRAAGMGRNAIADVYGCDPSTIRHWMVKFGLETRSPWPSLEEMTDKEIAEGIAKYARAFANRGPFCKRMGH